MKRPDTLAQERGQFSLRALLLATTLVAVAVGSLEWLRPTLSRLDVDSVFWSKRPTQFWRAASETRQLIMTAAIALTSVGAIVAVMGRGRIWLRIAALAITIPASALYLAHVSGAGNHLIGLTGQTRLSSTAVALTAGLAAIATMCGLSVLPLGLAGYRLQRPQGAPAFTESGIPTSWTYQQRLVQQIIAMSLVLGVTIAFGIYQIVRSRPRTSILRDRGVFWRRRVRSAD